MQVTEKIKLVWLYECWDKQSSKNKKKTEIAYTKIMHCQFHKWNCQVFINIEE